MKMTAFFCLLSVAFVSGNSFCFAQRVPQRVIEEKANQLIHQMTLKEKISMLHGNSKFTISGVKRLGIPEWHMSDGPHGVREEINRDNWNPAGWTNDYSTYFPTGTALAATWNPELSRLQGEALGEEARARGKDVMLGPGINIIRSPLGGRNFEYESEDPFLISQMCVPYIQGIQSRDVAACIKHYLANNQETDRMDVDVTMSERALREIYLPGFKAAVKQGHVYTLMGAYDKFRGNWCCENSYLMNTILRKELGFKGATISDWAAVHSTVKTALAGLDVEMGTDKKDYNAYFLADSLMQAVKEGLVPERLIDQKVKNILCVMLRTKVLGGDRFKGSINTDAHHQVAYKVASESVVLLKNENNLLPFRKTALKSIAVIGDNATRKQSLGGESSAIKAFYERTPLDGLKARLGDAVAIHFAQGYKMGVPITSDQIDEAVKQAKASDVAVIFAGLNHDYDTEGKDRPDMDLPYGQENLIKAVVAANPRTVLVLIAGSPVDMSRLNPIVPAILWGWYNGMESGNALADVLLGKVNPSGKMPFTVPVSLKDSPAHAMGNFPGKDKKVNYEEGILVGYRWFDTKEIKPMYAFGEGLSYTTFKYFNPRVSKKEYGKEDQIELRFTLKNTGKYPGAEIAQLYVSKPESKVERAEKELKAFKKVFLKQGESKEVVLTVRARDLSYFNEAGHAWTLESGKYLLKIGSSSQNIKFSSEILIK